LAPQVQAFSALEEDAVGWEQREFTLQIIAKWQAGIVLLYPSMLGLTAGVFSRGAPRAWVCSAFLYSWVTRPELSRVSGSRSRKEDPRAPEP
jgi:hypothetical protein